MPRLSIMAVLAYQVAANENNIDQNLKDNYSLAVAAGFSPAIASSSIMTDCTNIGDSGNTLAFDNNIQTRATINASNSCIKKYRLDYTNYATHLGASPLRVKTASFVAACGSQTCYFKVMVGNDPEPTSTSNAQCGPTFTGCQSDPGCHRRADCDLPGKYISLISDGTNVSVWEFLTWSLPTLQSSQIDSWTSNCSIWFPSSLNIAILSAASSADTSVALNCNNCCGPHDHKVTVDFKQSLTVKEIQFIANNSQIPPVKVELLDSDNDWKKCWEPNNSLQQYNIRKKCNQKGTKLKVTFNSNSPVFTWKQFTVLLGDSAPSCSVQQTTAQTNADTATTQSNTVTTNADAVNSQLTIATNQAAIVATQATAASGFAGDSISNPANANLDLTGAQNAFAIAQAAATATNSALIAAQTAYNAANTAKIAAVAANDANTLLVAQCLGDTVIAASAETSSTQASNALDSANAAQTNLASTTSKNSQAQVSLNEAKASNQVVIAQVAKISAASNASIVRTLLQQIVAIQTSTQNNQATASAQAAATTNAVTVSDLQAASTSTASTYTASSSCSTSQNNVSALKAQAHTAKNAAITDQTSVTTAIAAITTIQVANPLNTSINNCLSSVSPSAQTAADSSVSQAITDYNSIQTSQTTISNSCTSAIQSYQTAVTSLSTLVTSQTNSALVTVTSQTSTVASQLTNAATQTTLSGTLASQSETASAFGEFEQAQSFSTQASLAATSVQQSVQTAQTAYDAALATLQQLVSLKTTASTSKTNADNLVAQTSGQSSIAQTSALASQTSSTLALNSVNTAYASALLATQAALIDLNAIKASSVIANNNALSATASACSCSRTTFDTTLDPTSITLNVFIDGPPANYTLLSTQNSVAKVCGNKDGNFCGPHTINVIDAKTGAVVTLPNNFLSIKGQTLTLNSKSSADVGTYDYLLRVSLLLNPKVQKQIKTKVTIAMDCSSTAIKLLDPTQASEFSSTVSYHIDQPSKFYIPDITDTYSELNKLEYACGPFKYQTTIAETGASQIISLIESKPPFILFNTYGDVFEGNFQFSVQVGLANYLKVKPIEFKYNLTLKPCLVQTISLAALTIQLPLDYADIIIPDFNQTPDCGYKPISYKLTGATQHVTQMPTSSNRVIKISKKRDGRFLESAYLTVTPIYAPALQAFIKKVFALEIEVQFKDQTSQIADKNQIANDGSSASQTEDNQPALLSIKKISQSGLVTLGFSKEVIVLKNNTVLFDKNYFGQPRKLHDNLELLVLKDIENYSKYSTTMVIVNMTSYNLTVQMNFTGPLNVSAANIRDLLSVEIWNQTLLITKGNLMPVQLFFTPLNKTIPRQFSGTESEQMLIEVVEAAGSASKVATVTSGLLSIVLGVGLSQILGTMKGFVLICSFMCINLVYPAVLQTVMFTLVQFATFDVIDTVPIYIHTFGVDSSVPLNENFDETGYSSSKFVRNIGSLFLFIWIGLCVGIAGLIILKIKKLPQKLRDIIKKQTEKFFFNGMFSFVQQNYLVFSMSALISLTQIIAASEPIDLDNFFGITMLLIVTMMPTVLIILTCVRYSNLKNRNSRDFKLWGSGHISRLKMQQELTEADSKVVHAIQEFRLSKIATIFCAFGPYIRYFVTAYVIVFMRDVPAVQIFMVHLIQMFVLIFLIFLQPYTSKEENLTEIVNEVGVLAYILHLYFFTDWVTDATVKYNAGISLICVVSLQIVICVSLLLKNLTLKAKLYGKKYYIRAKHLKAMKQKDELKKANERLKSEKDQQEQAVFDHIHNGESVLDLDLVGYRAKFAGNKSDLIPVKAKNKTESQSEQKTKLIKKIRNKMGKLGCPSAAEEIFSIQTFEETQQLCIKQLKELREMQKAAILRAQAQYKHERSKSWPCGLSHMFHKKEGDSFQFDLSFIQTVPAEYITLSSVAMQQVIRNELIQQLAKSGNTRLQESDKRVRIENQHPLVKKRVQQNIQEAKLELAEFELEYVKKTFKALRFINQQMEGWPLKRIEALDDKVEEEMASLSFTNYPEKLFGLRVLILKVIASYLN